MNTHHRMNNSALRFALAVIALFWPVVARAEQTDAQATTPTSEVAIGAANGAPIQTDVRDRLLARLSPEVAAAFRLFVYVNKAASGPGAQRMSVFGQTDDGQLTLLHDWPVSTGRERIEQDAEGHAQSSVTPTGYFEIDARRIYISHMSRQWHEPMPYAMFFASAPGRPRTGLAIHGTDDTQAELLGTRASAGCVRLSTDNAQTLFALVRSRLRGPTPLLAPVTGNAAANPSDLLARDALNRPVLVDGYSVLIVIDDPTPPSSIEVSQLTPAAGSAQ